MGFIMNSYSDFFVRNELVCKLKKLVVVVGFMIAATVRLKGAGRHPGSEPVLLASARMSPFAIADLAPA